MVSYLPSTPCREGGQDEPDNWDDTALLHRHWQEVARDLGGDDGVLILDGSNFPKQGLESVGVKRQYCGELGKRANCQARVFLGYTSRQCYTLLDRRLYLPREWVAEATYTERRRRCGVPGAAPPCRHRGIEDVSEPRSCPDDAGNVGARERDTLAD
jgi:DDE superfamily endonuclease